MYVQKVGSRARLVGTSDETMYVGAASIGRFV